MRILGVNAYAHDAGLALLEDGRPALVLEEERFNRVKKTTAFPSAGIAFLRQHLNLRLRDCDAVAFPWRGGRFLATVGRHLVATLPYSLNLLRERASPNMSVPAAFRFFRVGTELARSFEEVTRPKVRYVGHHEAHACNAFFLSPFDRAAVLVMDAYGDECSTSFYRAAGTKIRTVGKNRFFDSLGIVFSMVTKYLGFRTIHDEGTVMALASHGTDALYPEFRKLITLLPEGCYTVDSRFFEYHRYGELRPVSRRFLARFGPSRRAGEPISQRHMDIAYALQRTVEEAILHVTQHLRTVLGEENLCFGGGLALNCLSNTRVLREAGFERVFVPPNPNDAGAALGAAFAVHYLEGAGRKPSWAMPRVPVVVEPYLGREFSESQVVAALRAAGVRHERREDAAWLVARELAQGKLVGWFQGRAEMGPRALGNRSILADPRDPFVPNALNERVKRRAWFRPYAPAVLAEHSGEFFEHRVPSPFMSFAIRVKSERRSQVPAVVARDGSARLQTVNETDNPRFHALIEAFRCLTGVPMVLNTSFNLQDPIVDTPADAVRAFLNSGLDTLVIQSHIARKPDDVRTSRPAAAAAVPVARFSASSR